MRRFLIALVLALLCACNGTPTPVSSLRRTRSTCTVPRSRRSPRRSSRRLLPPGVRPFRRRRHRRHVSRLYGDSPRYPGGPAPDPFYQLLYDFPARNNPSSSQPGESVSPLIPHFPHKVVGNIPHYINQSVNRSFFCIV